MTRHVVGHAMIHLSLKCNFTCDHCQYSSGPKVESAMPIDVAKNYLSQLPGLETEELGISGGEPTLYPHLDEVISYADGLRRETGYPKKIYMNSNGSWAVSEEYALKRLRALKEIGLDVLRVSDGVLHRKFNQQRQIENLRNIRDQEGIPKILIGEGYDIVAVGRARNKIPIYEWSFDEPDGCCDLTQFILADAFPETFFRSIYIFPDGVYACCYRSGYLGNEGSLAELVENGVNNPVFKVIGNYSLDELPEIIGDKISPRIRAEIGSLPVCAACNDLFDDEESIAGIRSESSRILKMEGKDLQKFLTENKKWDDDFPEFRRRVEEMGFGRIKEILSELSEKRNP